MTDQLETERIIVVGLNRNRLTKIMGLVAEQEQTLASPELDAALNIEFVPCLASMGSYDDENGSKVRYMANFVYHDGSAMTKFFDDAELRDSLKKVLMIGYEWQAGDTDKMKSYFQANNLSELSLECVKPNEGFDNLQSEMDFFKSLTEDAKSKHMSEHTMGPGKMANFVVSAAQQMKEERLAQQLADAEKAFSSAQTSIEQQNDPTIEEPTPPRRTPIDPNLPSYACRMCRTVLFGEVHLAKEHVQNLHSFKKANFNAKRPTVECQSIFCSDEVLQWLSPQGQDIEGKLACPKCSFKVGHWRWSGAQCSCGTWITPAIQIPISKVDKILPVSSTGEVSGIVTPAGWI